MGTTNVQLSPRANPMNLLLYKILPTIRISDLKIRYTKKMCPDKNFNPEKYIHYPSKEDLAQS